MRSIEPTVRETHVVEKLREARLGESPENVEAYLERMVRLLRTDGVRFHDNRQMRFTRLESIYAAGQPAGFHAEGRWVLEGETDPEPDGPATPTVSPCLIVSDTPSRARTSLPSAVLYSTWRLSTAIRS